MTAAVAAALELMKYGGVELKPITKSI